jgi:pSer/pThr/pTyr-binding forkhead associated (FHA) protein
LKIKAKNGKLKIVDLNSSNGTFVNDKEISKEEKV